MSKQIIQLHTLQQWFAVDPAVRSVILQNIKLKDRLYRFLEGKSKGPGLTEPKWVRCSKCAESPHPGYVLLEPRYEGIHPSQLSTTCLLSTYNEMTGVQSNKKIEPRLQLIFDLGHAVHHMFQTYGLNGAWGDTYKHEVPISAEHQEIAEQLMIEGHADADNILTIDDIPNSPYVYEVGLVHEYKTINSDSFKKLTRPKPEHKTQAMLYSAALNRPIVVYLYFSKNDSNLADFPVEFDAGLWQAISGKAQLLVNHYNMKQPPPATTGYHCQECGYMYQCVPYKEQMLKRKKA